MPITVGGTQITFNDSTTQASAARGGSSDVTFTSTNSNVTLTSASNALQRFVTGSPVPVNPTITMPNMTTVTAGPNIFKFRSASAYNVGINDAGGTPRQFILAGTTDQVDVWNTSTSSGVWAASTFGPYYSANAAPAADTYTGYRVGTTGSIFSGATVRLSSTEFAYVWTEQSASGSTNQILYAKLYTANSSTNTLTAGNTVTITTLNMSGSNTSFWPGLTSLTYDCDFAGRALVLAGLNSSTQSAPGFNAYGVTFGLVASGGVLYATTVVTVSMANDATCSGPAQATLIPAWVSYLGSNNAFAVAFYTNKGAQIGGQTNQAFYYYAYTLTGTTSPVLTAGSGNSSLTSTFGQFGAVRAGLTDFSARPSATNGVLYSYTPASNSVSATTLTTNGLNTINTQNRGASFAQSGFLYNSGAGIIGVDGVFYTLSGSGATLSAAISSGIRTKTTLIGDYTTVTGSTANTQAGFIASLNPGGAQVVIGGTRWQTINQGVSTMDVNTGSLPNGVTTLLSNNLGLNIVPNGASFTCQFVRIATPYIS